MTLAYTGNLKLALPTTGTESGVWGEVVNQQITALLDQAVAGTVSLTSMTDANYTLTAGNGNAANESRYMALLVPATVTLTAARNIIVPSTSKTYVVRNLSAGGFNVVVKTAAGAGVTVANGGTVIVYCDAVNVGKLSAAGATGGGADQVFVETNQLVTADYTLSTGFNAMSAGPVTINTGVTVTIPTGAVWSIV